MAAVFLHGQIQIFHFSRADHADLPSVCQPLVIDELPHAADAVSAHLRPGAVRIVHLHLEIRLRSRIDENQPVAPDAEMPVAEPPRQLRLLQGRNLLLKSVYIYVVIPAALHLREFHVFLSPFPPRPNASDPRPFSKHSQKGHSSYPENTLDPCSIIATNLPLVNDFSYQSPHGA